MSAQGGRTIYDEYITQEKAIRGIIKKKYIRVSGYGVYRLIGLVLAWMGSFASALLEGGESFGRALQAAILAKAA
ncbi:hypothetical protein PVNG_03743 [Plasmodium vivax North Korean]|uniref:Uncharacterized protein n=1 Tax=Plasmodium vivax North Korean TaxID=1035514 RepID=A0A0J9TS15_PLAVI|nr:hypothetical protein PVNG_03743 [Plasmodium vivax North Korean]